MQENTFDSTDDLDVQESRLNEEARLAEIGDKLIQQEEEREQSKYDQARKDAESELRYAGKFKSAEDLEKAYKELEKKLGQKEETVSEEGAESGEESGAESEPTDEPDTDNDDEADEAVSEEADFLKSASEEYYSNNNQLKPETIQRLKEMPSDKLVEAYLNNIKNSPAVAPQVLTDADAKSIVDSVGGDEAYNQTLAWAADNLSANEVAAYDNVVNSGNKDAIFFAVQALNQKYRDSVGFEGQQVSGKNVRGSVKGYRSQAELARAISDPRYRNDPAYRLDVETKLAASGDLM
jgi:hypothetical protein